jgi:iron complex outermembrane recepter protein
MRHRSRRFAATGPCGLALVVGLNVAGAQTEPLDSGALEEIVVTAERREESVLDTPVAVTALSGEFLEERGLSTVEDLTEYAPSLQIFTEQVNTELYMIRGIGRANEDLSTDSGVAVYVDGVYVSQQGAANAATYDLERVEILRGPQGTLYGKNAIGGVINLISRAPRDTLDASASAEFGELNLRAFQGAVGGPITEALSGRLAAMSREKDGAYHSLVTGERGNNIDVQAVRGSLKLDPSDALSVTGIVDYSDADQDGVLKSVIVDEPGAQYIFKDFLVVDEFPTQESSIRTSRSDTFGEQGVEQMGASLRFDYDAGSGTFTSLSGYRTEESFNNEDVDRTAQRSLEQGGRQDTDSFSQEFRFVSSDDGALSLGGRLDWAAGLYWFHEEGTRDHRLYLNARIPGSDPGDPDDPDNGLIGPGSPDAQNSTAIFLQDITTDSYAAFGQATYDVTDRFNVTVGMRYTVEEKDFSVDARSEPGVPNGDPYTLFQSEGPFVASASDEWNSFTPKLVLEYGFSDDLNTYVSYAYGFKSGGFNGQPDTAAALVPFDPEDARNLEFGLKTALFDRRLQLATAVFQTDVEDLQVAGVNAAGLIITGNAADSRIRGLELEVQARPVAALGLRASVSLLEAEFRNYFKEEFDPTITDGPPFVIVDKTGDRLDDTPEYAVGLGGDYTWGLGDLGSLVFGADYIAKGDTVTNENTKHASSYAVINARLDWYSSDGRWSIGAWVNNLTDETYYRGGGPVPDFNKFITRVGLVADPRAAGITLRARIGD